MRVLTFYGSLVLSVCTASLWFSGMVLAPKARFWFDEVDPLSGIPDPLTAIVSLSRATLLVIGIVFTLGVLGMLLPLISPLWRKLPAKAIALSVSLLSLFSLGFLCFHGFGLWWTASDAVIAHNGEKTSYRRALEEFTILEQTEGRIEETKEGFRRLLSYQPQPILDPSQLTRRDANGRLSQLLKMLHDSEDPAVSRRLLATTMLFEDILEGDRRRSEILLERANELTSKNHENVSELFQWISQQPPEDWIPITLFRVAPPRE